MRGVTTNERAFVRRFFGDSVRVGRLRIGLSPSRRSWSPLGNMVCLSKRLFAGASARHEVDLRDAQAASIFAHEVLHVWQRQHGRAVSREGAYLQALYALGWLDPYAYDRTLTHPKDLLAAFVLGNIEQQGRIFQDYVCLSMQGRSTARFTEVARWVCESRS